jgi:hypothetical protein
MDLAGKSWSAASIRFTPKPQRCRDRDDIEPPA